MLPKSSPRAAKTAYHVERRGTGFPSGRAGKADTRLQATGATKLNKSDKDRIKHFDTVKFFELEYGADAKLSAAVAYRKRHKAGVSVLSQSHKY